MNCIEKTKIPQTLMGRNGIIPFNDSSPLIKKAKSFIYKISGYLPVDS